MRSFKPINGFVLAIFLPALLLPMSVSAQAVQAAANLAEEVEADVPDVTDRAEALAKAGRMLGQSEQALGWARDNPGALAVEVQRLHDDLADAVEEMAEHLDNALRFERSRREFDEAVVRFQDVSDEFASRGGSEQAQLFSLEQRVGLPAVTFTTLGSSTPPGAHTLVKDVVFSIGYSLSAAQSSRSSHEATVSTNLLGAGVATVIDALGSTDLSSYFKNNVVVGAGLGLASENRISGVLGFGLAGMRLGRRISVWPALNIEQVDTADGRIPGAVRTQQPSESTWSNVALTFGVIGLSPDRFKARVEDGQVVPVMSVGLSLPVYYPGDPATTLAAMFTDKRRNFLRSGNVGLVLGVSLPLLRLDTKPKTAP